MMGILGCFLKLVHLGHKLFSGSISAELSKEVPNVSISPISYTRGCLRQDRFIAMYKNQTA